MSRSKRFIIASLIVILTTVGVVAPARPARAVFGIGDVVVVAQDIMAQIFHAIDTARKFADKLTKTANDITFKNSLLLFAGHALNYAITQVATAGPGQKPLFLTNPRTFLKNTANAALGDYINDFTKVKFGEIGPGAAISSVRTKFIISRFLRSAVPDQLASCREDKQVLYGVRSQFSPGIAQAQRPAPQNDHEKRIDGLLQIYQDQPNSTIAAVAISPTQPVTCSGIGPEPTTTAAPTWLIVPGIDIGTTTAQDCQNYQEQAINNEKSKAGEEVRKGFTDCQNGLAGVTQTALNAATASDVLNSINSIEPSKVPGALARSLSKDTSDIGGLVGAFAGLEVAVQDRVTGEQTNLQPNLLPRTSTVAGDVLAPSSSTLATLFGSYQQNSGGTSTYTGSGLADILKGITSFINSPVGKLFAQTFKNKCGLNPDACRGPSNPKSSIGQLLFTVASPTGIAGAQQQLASIGQPQLISGNPGQNEIPVTDLLSSGGLIDSGFRQAIEDQLTVTEAMSKKLLDGTKVFGFDRNGIETRDGYSFRALQYLRKFRVIPVGWELAAKYKQQFDNRNLTLNKLVKAFNQCGQDPLKGTCSASGSTCSSSADCGPSAGFPAGGGACINLKFTGSNEVCSNNPEQGCQQDSDCLTGGTCGANPYCGLVDPNWVLKAPQSFCRRQGAGEEILTKEFVCDQNNIDAKSGDPIPNGLTCNSSTTTPVLGVTCTDTAAPNCVKSTTNPHPDTGRWVISRNTDTCADVQSCIAENDDGSCIAYGYCVQERQTYKFNGIQCQAQNASCTTYVSSVGEQVNYLAKTLDFNACNADNAGCQWYCHKACSLDSSRSCTVDADCAPNAGVCSGGYDETTKTWTCADPTLPSIPASNPTINFTSKVETCSQDQAGCQQYVRTTNNSNLLPNSGFETISNGAQVGSGIDATFTDWLKTGNIRTLPITPDDPLVTASNAVTINASGDGTGSISQTIDTGTNLDEQVFSASVRAKAPAACNARVEILTTLHRTDGSLVQTTAASDTIAVTPDWQSLVSTLVIPERVGLTGPDDNKVTVVINLGSCANLTFDSAQLEHDGPTVYKDYGTINNVYLGAKRQLCTRQDVGCQFYTPVDGSAVIPGQAKNGDRCDAANVGCDLFHLEPITTVPQRAGGDVTVVATKGQQCTASQVGCEEYTNLDEVAKGGEGKAYYQSVKQCLKPNPGNPDQLTYYTWVGDAAAGFVLRAYDLLKSNLTGAPCTNLTVGTTTAAPTCDDSRRPDPTDTICNASTFATNPDCAQYFDSGLIAYYRLRQSTISITPDCHPFRNTIDQSTGSAGNIYYLSPTENVSCSAEAAGCRAYTGNAARTSRQDFSDNFEGGTTSNWVGGTISTAAIQAGGHSMQISAGDGAAFLTASAIKGKLTDGKTYQVSLLAAAVNPATTPSTAPRLGVWLGTGSGTTFNAITPFQRDAGGAPLTVSPTYNGLITPPGPEWHSYTFGLLTIKGDPSSLTLGLTVDNNDVVVDNVTLTEINDSLYLVSSTVPACPSDQVGCAAYKNGSGQTVDLKSFSRICSEQAVNCEALLDTHNSTSADSETVKNVTTPADNVVTVINSPTFACSAASKGCQAFGSPTYNNDHLVTAYQTVYLKNNPDQYPTSLCTDGRNNTPNELFCRAYKTTTGTAAFFKDPKGQTCEFRTDGSATGGQWFVTGTNMRCPTVTPPEVGQPVGPSCAPTCVAAPGSQRPGRPCVTNSDCPGSFCAGDPSAAGKVLSAGGAPVVGSCGTGISCAGAGTCVGGGSSGKSCTDNSQCGGFTCQINVCTYQVGNCPSDQNSCTEYRDPSDPKNCRAECPLVQQGGSPVYVDSTCAKTICQGGSREGQNCQTSLDCGDGGQCVGAAGSPTTGLPGCRPYYYLSSSLEDSASGCNGQINLATGCRPFNNTSNPTLNFRGQ